MDRIILFGTGAQVFNVEVVEVAKALPWGQSQMKASMDLRKAT